MDYTEEETTARAEAALKRMLSTPPKPHSEMKIGKRKAKVSQRELPKKEKGRSGNRTGPAKKLTDY
jgi:hypothetical protein